MQIKFSKKLMDKFGDIVLKRFDEKSLNPSPIKYRIDWRYSNAKLLKDWMEEQIMEPDGEIVAIARTLKKSNYNDTVISCLKWVMDNITYMKDSDRWKTPEKWQTAKETYELKTGDCEDGAILLYFLAVFADVPSHMLRINCGDVNGGGHCWVEYRSDFDARSYYMDWCYWANTKRIGVGRLPKEDLKNYYKVWWGFNDVNYYKGYTNI